MTVSPFLKALAEAERFPLRYFVPDSLSMVTDVPSVDTVKVFGDTLATVPHVPPVAGPDRAPVVGKGDGLAEVAADAGDAAQAESPITAHTTADPMTLVLVFDSDRRTAPVP